MKVVIAGASAAGLYLAYNLAREGVEVEVYERKERVDRPARTLIVTSRLIDVLGFVPQEAILNKVNFMQLEAGGEKIRLKLSSPDLIIERGKFFSLLADMARGKGALLYFGHELVSFFSINGGRGKFCCQVRCLKEGEIREVKADYLVGADGALSRIKGFLSGLKGSNLKVIGKNPGRNFEQSFFSRILSFRSGERSNGKKQVLDLKALLQWRIEVKNLIESDTCYVWFDPQRTRYFFWALPESAEVVAVGLIADRMDMAREALRSFLEEKMSQARLLEVQAGLVPLPGYFSPLSRLLSHFPFSKRKLLPWFAFRPENKRDGFEKDSDRQNAENSVADWLRSQRRIWDSGFSSGKEAIKTESRRPSLSSQELFYSPLGEGNGAGSIFLVGDAACQVKATTVGGVVAGLRGAKAASSLILGRLEEAKREFKRLCFELNLHSLLRQILNRFGEEDYRRLLSLLRKDRRLASLISRHTRDDLASFFFRLLFRYPRLFWIGLRTLFPKRGHKDFLPAAIMMRK